MQTATKIASHVNYATRSTFGALLVLRIKGMEGDNKKGNDITNEVMGFRLSLTHQYSVRV